MEITASVEGRPHRREHRRGGGRFRAEIEVDRGSPSIPRGPDYGFAAAVREPLVRLQRPKFDFERWDWDYFAWPHARLDANLQMRDSDPEATLEADRKASESFLNRSMLQMKRYAMDQDTQEQHPAAWPHEQLDANPEMRNSEPGATLEADRKASEGFLNWSTLQLEGYVMDQYPQQQNAITLPHNQHGALQGMKDCNRKGTLDADKKARESLLSRTRLQLKRHEMDQDQHMKEQPKEPDQKASESRLIRSTPWLKRRATDQGQHTQEQQKEPDQKARESLLSRSRLRLERREMDQGQHTQEQQKEPELWPPLVLDGKPVGHRSTRHRRGCAEANGILDHGRALQGSWAC